jgi:hypothetical protein
MVGVTLAMTARVRMLPPRVRTLPAPLLRCQPAIAFRWL